jgi:hypothetical protein
MSTVYHDDKAVQAEQRMNAWQLRAAELADHAIEHLSNRNDAMGAYGSKGAFCRMITAEITEARQDELFRRLKSHFLAKTLGGLYPQSVPDADGNWFARFGCIDLDLKSDHPNREYRRSRNYEYAVSMVRSLESLGIPCLLEDSNGEGGYHIWLRLNQPIGVARLHSFLQSLVADAEQHGFERSFQRVDENNSPRVLPDGKPDLGCDLPETFPKQAQPTGKGLGNFIRLPGKHHTYNHWSRFWSDGVWLDVDQSVVAWLSLPAADASLIPEIDADVLAESIPKRSSRVVEIALNETLVALAERTIDQQPWCELLEGAGWKMNGNSGGAESTWTRPGKPGGVSATLNHGGNNLLHVFSSAVSGLESSKSYGKWRFYCWTYGFENRQIEAAKAFLPREIVAEHDREWMSRNGAEIPAETSWLELLPVAGPEPDVMCVDDFPVVVREIIRGVVEMAEVPIELPGLMALGVLATAAQKKFQICSDGSHIEPLCLWVCPALNPGERKTAVVNILTSPLREWEQREHARLAPVIAEQESVRKTAEQRVQYLRAKAARTEDPTERHQIPREIKEIEDQLKATQPYPLLTTDDCTPEHIATLLSKHGEKLAVVSDEGGIFDIVAGRYSKGVANMDVFLQSHSGSPVRVHRGSREPVNLLSPCLTIAVSCQPYVLQEMGANQAFRGRGLLARFLFAVPRSRLGYRTLVSKEIPKPILDKWISVVCRMLDIPQQSDEFENAVPQTLRLCSAALKLWKAEQVANEMDMRPGGLWESNTGWASKYPGAVLRVAGVLHCAICVDGNTHPASVQVSESTMQSAIRLGRKLKCNSLHAFGTMALTEDQRFANRIADWIKRESITLFTGRECSKRCNSAGSVRDLDGAFEILKERGWIRQTLRKPTGGGRPSHPFEVNPAVRSFADKTNKTHNQLNADEVSSVLSSISANSSFVGSAVELDDFDFEFPSVQPTIGGVRASGRSGSV